MYEEHDSSGVWRQRRRQQQAAWQTRCISGIESNGIGSGGK